MASFAFRLAPYEPRFHYAIISATMHEMTRGNELVTAWYHFMSPL